MTESNLYRVEYLNKYYYNDATHVSSNNLTNAVKEAERGREQEKWRDIISVSKIGKIYL